MEPIKYAVYSVFEASLDLYFANFLHFQKAI